MRSFNKKKLALFILLLALLVGIIAYFQRPKEVYLEGEVLEDGTVRYEDDDMTVVADWNYSENQD